MLKGGSVGSSLVPMLIGYCMKSFGTEVLSLCVLSLGIGMCVSYLAVHRSLTAAAAERRRKLTGGDAQHYNGVPSAMAASSDNISSYHQDSRSMGVLRSAIVASEEDRSSVTLSSAAQQIFNEFGGNGRE